MRSRNRTGGIYRESLVLPMPPFASELRQLRSQGLVPLLNPLWIWFRVNPLEDGGQWMGG